MDPETMSEMKRKIEEKHREIEVALKKVEDHFEDVNQNRFFAINGFKIDLKELDKATKGLSEIVSYCLENY